MSHHNYESWKWHLQFFAKNPVNIVLGESLISEVWKDILFLFQFFDISYPFDFKLYDYHNFLQDSHTMSKRYNKSVVATHYLLSYIVVKSSYLWHQVANKKTHE